MTSPDFKNYRQRLERAFKRSAGNVMSFGPQLEISWGLETRRTSDDYYWDGMKRGLSPKSPRILFQYTLEGRGEYAEGGKLWAVEPGRAFTVLLPSAHRYYLPEGFPPWTFFWMIVQHPYAIERVRKLRQREGAAQQWEVDSPVMEAAAALFETGCEGKWRDGWSFEQMLFSWVLEMEKELHHRRYPQDERQGMLDEMRRVVCGRLARPLGTAELADLHRMERTTFSRKFKATTGLTPAAYATEVRLEEALKLLRTAAKLEEVAERTGFADANHFCKVFRRYFHSSPGVYRRLILKR